MLSRWLYVLPIFVDIIFVSAKFTARSTNLINSRHPFKLTCELNLHLSLRGGSQADQPTIDGNEEKVAFVNKPAAADADEHEPTSSPTPSEKEKKNTSTKINNEINTNLKEQFSDASLSLQRLLELGKVQPFALNFSNEIKTRYGETISQIYKWRSISMLRMELLRKKIKQQCDAHLHLPLNYDAIQKKIKEQYDAHLHLHLNYDAISQSMGNAKKIMKEGTRNIGAVSFDSTASILLATFILSSLGSSLGFISFLYFVSVGFGASISIISSSALIFGNIYSKKDIPVLTNLHTGLALLWSLRLIAFLLHREYINWPQWHEKLMEVDQRADVQSRITIWMTCSLFYSMMMIPCINRMKEATIGTTVSKWGRVGKTGVYMQGGGLFLETVADFQKGRFKKLDGNRNRFCNVGVWRYFSHPNYLGEIIFWFGTFLGGVGCNNSMSDWIISTVGLIFILTVMKGACDSLNSKHIKYYGRDEEYMSFRRKRSFFGPVPQFVNRKSIL